MCLTRGGLYAILQGSRSLRALPMSAQEVVNMSSENIEPGQTAGGLRLPANNSELSNQEFAEMEVDIGELAERGEKVPHAEIFRVPIDCERVRITTQHPTGELLLSRVHKRPCAFELIAEF